MWKLGLVVFVLLATDSAHGQFQLSFGAPPTQAAVAGGFDPNCADKLDNCELFGQSSCGGQYQQWAQDNCALTCKFCTGPPTTPPPCVDLLDNCQSYGQGSCTDPQYASWAKANCRRTCRMCPADVLARLDAQTTTIPPAQCVDKVDCRLYGQTSCSGDYEAWAKENCMNFCGFCVGVPTTSKPCLDTRPNCNQYEKDMCSNPDYSIWVDDNCAQYCGRCSGQCQDTTTQTTADDQCKDLVTTCIDYTKDMICSDGSIYKPWATVRCALYCGFCTPKGATPEPCEDTIPNCPEYTQYACHHDSYRVWVETHCRKYCGRCGVTVTTSQTASTTQTAATTHPTPQTQPPTTGQAAATTKPTSTSAPPSPVTTRASIVTTAVVPDSCQDLLQFCNLYSRTACTTDEAWGRQYCARSCGLCDAATEPVTQQGTPPVTARPSTTRTVITSPRPTPSTTARLAPSSTTLRQTSATTAATTKSTAPPASCRDQLGFCDGYTASACLNVDWARQYCQRRCNLC